LVVLALLLVGCAAKKPAPALDPASQQVVVSNLTADCFYGDKAACARLPEEKEKLIRLLAK